MSDNLIKIVQYQPAHADLIELREHEREELDFRIFNAAVSSYNGACNTLMIEGRVLCFVGYYLMWPGVLEVAVLPSVYVDKYPIAFHTHVKRCLDAIQEAHKAHRLQTASRSDELTSKWMERLGFKQEGKLEKYTASGVDYNMWARIDNGQLQSE